MGRTLLHLIPAGWRHPFAGGEVLRAATFVVRCAGAATLAYIVTNWADLPHPVWAIMSALIVSQEAWTETRASISARIFGTVIGVVVAIAVNTAVAERASLATQIAGTVAICAAIARWRPAFRVSMWTGPLVLLTASPLQPIFVPAFARLSEVVLGALVAAAVHWCVKELERVVQNMHLQRCEIIRRLSVVKRLSVNRVETTSQHY